MPYKTLLLKPAQSNYLDKVIELQQEALGEFPLDETVYGETFEDVLARDIPGFVHNPRNIITGLINEAGGLAGFSLAIPIGDFDRTKNTSRSTAYIYWTALQKSLRGQGLVSQLQFGMHNELLKAGYNEVIEDLKIEQGYAANVITAYAGAISMIEPHNRWPEVGYQARVVIDISDPNALPQ